MARFGIDLALAVVFTAVGVFALVEAVRASSYAYESAFKRTKGFWVAVATASALALVFNLYTVYLGARSSLFIVLIAVTAAGVFLADVRPAVAIRRR
ncbi:DUF2516 family protein [Rothia sp. ZJ932]|nr:DUF2516 family protein [Rothia sp. ZJ1223]QRZ62653.1 DUF2516 family protein [Rothia sp. ZJ932]